MGALVEVTLVGTVFALGLGWVGRTRSKRNREKIIQLEKRIVDLENLELGNRLSRLEDFERETLEKIPLMLENLAQMLSEFAQANPEIQSLEFQASLTKLRDAARSAKIIQEDLAISSRAAHWLKKHRYTIVNSAYDSAFNKDTILQGSKEIFIKEIALLLALLSRIMERDMIEESSVILKEWEQSCFPKASKSNYLLMLNQILHDFDSDLVLPQEDKTILKNYMRALLGHIEGE
jgi:hypothetical protein